MEWMILPYRRYFDFSGRSRRMEFWMFQVFQLLATIVIAMILLSSMPWSEMGDENATAAAEPGPLFWVSMILLIVYALGTFIPSLALTIRRLHDQDKSGWWYLISFIPLGGLMLLIFMFLDGTHGPNRWGADPKDPNQSRIFD